MKPVSTFSIVAFDPETGDLGVATASKFLAVGSVVPFAEGESGDIDPTQWYDAAREWYKILKEVQHEVQLDPGKPLSKLSGSHVNAQGIRPFVRVILADAYISL